jgi:hypothetical protein
MSSPTASLITTTSSNSHHSPRSSPRPIIFSDPNNGTTINSTMSLINDSCNNNGVSTSSNPTSSTYTTSSVFGLISWSSPSLSLMLFLFGLGSWISLVFLKYSLASIVLHLVVLCLLVSALLHLAKSFSEKSAHAAEIAARVVVQVSGKVLPQSLLSIPMKSDEIRNFFNSVADLVITLVGMSNRILEWNSIALSGRALSYAWLAARVIHIFSPEIFLSLWVLLFIIGFLISHFRNEFSTTSSIVVSLLKKSHDSLFKIQTEAFKIFQERREIASIAIPSLVCVCAYVFYGYYSISTILTVIASLIAANDAIESILKASDMSLSSSSISSTSFISASPLAGSPVNGSGKVTGKKVQ